MYKREEELTINDKKLGTDNPKSLPIFVLCDRCYWCAIYFDRNRLPMKNRCPQCEANNNETI
jgi:predicted Zn-ribbon and HTH transcriptional regulator